ncbi:hypothetical protein AXF42_Ash000212 [Apostasia shenzhenica]|uniref:Uncharacterized protein n=1 Tax=Apostasia shenzhenica TaxID=1088818 RepID=A0A2I0AFN8_9ASPA|nr:hypothetical protein AXF42_Ash000212 [Apostasia shenzhenica]
MAAAIAAALATSLCSSSPLSLYSPSSRANVFFSSLHDHLPRSRCHSIRRGGIGEEVETVSQKRFSGKGKDEKTFFPADGSRGEAGVSNSAAFASARIQRKDGGLVIDLKDQQA